MMDPWNGYGFGKENRQSPQISRALWYQASNLSDTGTKSVENDSDIGFHRECSREGRCTDQALNGLADQAVPPTAGGR